MNARTGAHEVNTRGRLPLLALVMVACVGLTGCGGGAPAGPRPGRDLVGTYDYQPEVAADIYLRKPAPAHAPLAVLVPGGGWSTADRSGLAPLATRLAEHGWVVVNTTYRAADAGATFPTPVQDVACAVRFSVDRARSLGVRARPVVVIGHSAGAHLAALAALAPDEFSADCAWPTTRADALVGLSGPYDTARIPDVASALLGGDTNPRHARRADALSWAGHRPEVPVLLVHGRADTVVPTDFTTDFAAALRGSGHEVDVRLLPKADHPDTYRARTVGPLIERWASTIAAAPR